MKSNHPILYKYAVTGAIQQWQIFVDGNSFYTVSGQQGGVLTTSASTYCSGKNIGRANATTPAEQAEAEALAKWTKKKNEGYAENIDKAGATFFEPMLAHEWKKYEKLLFTVPTWGQPKLDGLRCDNANSQLMSRNGKPFVSCPHLHQNDVRLDGELYNHEFKEDFNKIVSLVKKTKPTYEDVLEAAEKVEMWVYDFPEHKGVFSERYKELQKWYNSLNEKAAWFKIVPTVQLKNMEDLIKFHASNIEQGYEGTIVRLDLGNYENKRSKQLLKYKDFIDEEFKIVGYEEGEGGRAGTIGFFIMEHDKNPEQTFKSNVKGDFEFLKDVWNNAEKYVGTKATVKYFQRTPKKEDGSGDVPRFPYIIKLNRDEYE